MKMLIKIISILFAIITVAIVTYNITTMLVLSNLQIDYTPNKKNITVTYEGETELYDIPQFN